MDLPPPTCFAFTRGIKVVVGAQQLALSVRPAVIDARRQVGAHVHLSCDVGARLESEKTKENNNLTTVHQRISENKTGLHHITTNLSHKKRGEGGQFNA